MIRASFPIARGAAGVSGELYGERLADDAENDCEDDKPTEYRIRAEEIQRQALAREDVARSAPLIPIGPRIRHERNQCRLMLERCDWAQTTRPHYAVRSSAPSS